MLNLRQVFLSKQDDIYDVLKEIARAKDIITYIELAHRVGLPTPSAIGDAFPGFIGEVRGEISANEVGKGRPMISAIVVNKDTGMPGQGFYNLARNLGRYRGNDEQTWVDEVKAVYKFW